MTELRITTSTGALVRDPDRAMIRAAVGDAAAAGRGAFVVLDGDRTADAPFLQAIRTDGAAWRVEVRRVEAGGGEGFAAVVHGVDELVDVLWSWAIGSAVWQRLHWTAIGTRPLAAAG